MRRSALRKLLHLMLVGFLLAGLAPSLQASDSGAGCAMAASAGYSHDHAAPVHSEHEQCPTMANGNDCGMTMHCCAAVTLSESPAAQNPSAPATLAAAPDALAAAVDLPAEGEPPRTDR